jgi:hypothetical protein
MPTGGPILLRVFRVIRGLYSVCDPWRELWRAIRVFRVIRGV